MKNSGNIGDVYGCTFSKGCPPLPPPPKPMTETTLQTITTQKGKFIEPSSSSTMEKYTYDEQMNLSLANTTTITRKAIEMGLDLPASVNVVSSSKQLLVSQPPEIELPGDIGSELALPYYANVEWPKPKFNNNLIINLDDYDGPIEDVKRRKITMTSSRTCIDESNADADLTLSCVWLKRFLHNGSKVVTKPEEVVPSIAAMAMMGRALNGSRPFERQKRGAVTVWNT